MYYLTEEERERKALERKILESYIYFTQEEVDRMIKYDRVVIYDNIEQYIEMLKSNGIWEGETAEEIKENNGDLKFIEYEGNEYVVEIAL